MRGTRCVVFHRLTALICASHWMCAAVVPVVLCRRDPPRVRDRAQYSAYDGGGDEQDEEELQYSKEMYVVLAAMFVAFFAAAAYFTDS